MSAVDTPLERAKALLSIYDLWALLGLPGRPGKSCKSPFREDHTASFSVYRDGRRWKDFASAESGDAVDFLARALGLSSNDACREFIRIAGGGNTLPAVGKSPAKKSESEESKKKRKRERWPVLEVPTDEELCMIAGARGFSVEGLRVAADRGLLWCADSAEGRAWVVTDSKRLNAQARLLSGKTWKCIGGKKARTLPGSEAAWPIGLREASSFDRIALVEGSSDFLAAFHLAWVAGRENDVAPVAMLGASLAIPDDALPLFEGRSVRIFPDNDAAGLGAAARWMGQLERVECKVDFFSFDGLLTTSGEPVKDLCDFVVLDVDSWEHDRDSIESAFHFGGERRAAA